MPAPGAALEAVLAQHQEVLDQAIRVVAAARRLRAADLDDFRQDVLAEVLRRDAAALRRCQGGRGAFTYFRRVADRVAVKDIRHRLGRRPARRSETSAPAEPPEPTVMLREDPRHPDSARAANGTPPPIEVAQTQCFVRRAFEGAFRELSREAQSLLALRFARERSVRAIAKAVGRSRGAISKRISAALAQLHAKLLGAGVHRDDAALAVSQQGLKSHFLSGAPREGAVPSRAEPSRALIMPRLNPIRRRARRIAAPRCFRVSPHANRRYTRASGRVGAVID